MPAKLAPEMPLSGSQYVGPVPLPIHYYNRSMDLQNRSRQPVTQEQVKNALQNVILPADVHRRIGPTVNFGSSLFLYDPPGNGKTTIAMAIARLIAGTDPIWIPYSSRAGGYIIQIHDRLVHKQIPMEGRTKEFGRYDRRWGLFERPTVTVGGELKMEALDLRYDPISRIYEASLQMKAYGGCFCWTTLAGSRSAQLIC